MWGIGPGALIMFASGGRCTLLQPPAVSLCRIERVVLMAALVPATLASSAPSADDRFALPPSAPGSQASAQPAAATNLVRRWEVERAGT
mgnify:CR=1 FL=1